MSLDRLITSESLREHAGERYYDRGLEYFHAGAVQGLREDENVITAKVQGNDLYEVRLSEDDGLSYECSCPLGAEGEFCKHAVAVGLAWLHRDRKEKPSVGMADLRAYLSDLPSKELVELILEQAKADDRFLDRLLMEVAGRDAQTDLKTYRTAIDNAVAGRGRVDYDYFRGVAAAFKALRGLLKAGKAAEVIDLAEYAIRAIENRIEEWSDHDGDMHRLIEELEDLHADACDKARPDAIELARRLFEWKLGSEWDAFSEFPKSHRAAMGKKGLEEYRRLARAEWDKVRPLRPGGKDEEKYGRRGRLERIVESLAETLDDWIEVKAKDLSTELRFDDIARRCQEAGRHDLALEWAERGMKEFPETRDRGLRAILVAEYVRLGRRGDAMKLIWKSVDRYPTFEGYEWLRKIGVHEKNWPEWRAKAIRRMTEHYGSTDRSPLVQVYLLEEDVDAAWNAAKEGKCWPMVWIQLATALEKRRPLDAASIYQRQVEFALKTTDKQAYEAAVKHIEKTRTLLPANQFKDWILTVRASHARKRTFIAMLAGAGL